MNIEYGDKLHEKLRFLNCEISKIEQEHIILEKEYSELNNKFLLPPNYGLDNPEYLRKKTYYEEKLGDNEQKYENLVKERDIVQDEIFASK